MAPAEQDRMRTETARLPRVEPPPGPRRAWPLVVAAVAAGLLITVVALALLRDDNGRVRSEAVKAAAPTTVVATTTTQPTAATTATTTAGTANATTASAAPATSQPSRQAWEDLRLSVDGLGPVDIGMTPAEASAAAGVQIRIDPKTDLGTGCVYARADRGPDDRMFMVVDGRIVRIDIGGRGTPSQTRTVSGIRVGATEDDVKRTYPGRITVQPHEYVSGGHYLVYTPADPSLQHLRMLFETDGKVVTSFRAGLVNAVNATEGCA